MGAGFRGLEKMLDFRDQVTRLLCKPPFISRTKPSLPRLTEQETTLTTRLDAARARAEANFRKEERAKDGANALMEYQANIRSIREKTERLRALRLAKEAADRNEVDSSDLSLKRKK